MSSDYKHLVQLLTNHQFDDLIKLLKDENISIFPENNGSILNFVHYFLQTIYKKLCLEGFQKEALHIADIIFNRSLKKFGTVFPVFKWNCTLIHYIVERDDITEVIYPLIYKLVEIHLQNTYDLSSIDLSKFAFIEMYEKDSSDDYTTICSDEHLKMIEAVTSTGFINHDFGCDYYQEDEVYKMLNKHIVPLIIKKFKENNYKYVGSYIDNLFENYSIGLMSYNNKIPLYHYIIKNICIENKDYKKIIESIGTRIAVDPLSCRLINHYEYQDNTLIQLMSKYMPYDDTMNIIDSYYKSMTNYGHYKQNLKDNLIKNQHHQITLNYSQQENENVMDKLLQLGFHREQIFIENEY